MIRPTSSFWVVKLKFFAGSSRSKNKAPKLRFQPFEVGCVCLLTLLYHFVYLCPRLYFWNAACIAHIYLIVRRGYYPPFLNHPPFCIPPILFFKIVLSPQINHIYLFIKNFAFRSSVDAVQNVTVKKILSSVWFTIFIKSSCLPNKI